MREGPGIGLKSRMHSTLQRIQEQTARIAVRWGPWLAVLLVLDLELRYFLVSIRNPVFYRDEAESVAVARLARCEFWDYLKSAWASAHFILLRWWPQVPGQEEVSARSLSLVAVLLATWLLYRGGRLWFGRPLPAVVTVTLVMCSPVLLERTVAVVKPYGLALLAAVWVWERMEVLSLHPDRKGAWVWFGCAAVLAGNTQPVLFAWLAALAAVWMRRCTLRRGWRWWERVWRAVLVPVVMLIAAAPSLVAAAAYAGAETGCGRVGWSDWGASLVVKFWLRVVAELTPIIYYSLYHALDDYISAGVKNLLHLPPETYVLLGVLVVSGAMLMARAVGGKIRAYAADTVILAVAPVLLLAVGALVNARLIWVWKCFSAVSVGTALLIASLVSGSRGLAGLLVAATLLRTTVHYPYYAASASGKASDAKEAAQFIACRARPDDLIVLANTALSPAFSFYYKGPGQQVHHPYDRAIRFYRMAEMYQMQTNRECALRTVQRIREAARAGRRVWFLEGGTPEPLPDHPWYSTRELPLFRAGLQERFTMVTNQEFATTCEPFAVSLWEPRGGSKDGG